MCKSRQILISSLVLAFLVVGCSGANSPPPVSTTSYQPTPKHHPAQALQPEPAAQPAPRPEPAAQPAPHPTPAPKPEPAAQPAPHPTPAPIPAPALAKLAGTWEGTTEFIEHVTSTAPTQGFTQPPTYSCDMSGTLRLQLTQDGSTVRADGQGTARGNDCQRLREGSVRSTGTIMTDRQGISFTTFDLLGCQLAPFIATVTGDTLAAVGVTGITGLTCSLGLARIQLHRSS